MAWIFLCSNNSAYDGIVIDGCRVFFSMSNSTPPDIVLGHAPYALTTMIRGQLQFVLLIILLLKYHNSLRDRTYLLREALVSPRESPWHKLYNYGNDSSFLHMTGLNREAFGSLLDCLFDLDQVANNRRHGRPPLLGPWFPWLVSLLFGKYHELQISLYDIWDHSLCLQPGD